MKELNFAQFVELADASSILDNRFAVIAEQLIDVTQFDDKHVVTLYTAEAIYSASELQNVNVMTSENFITAYQFDDFSECQQFFIKKVTERLALVPEEH